MQALTEQLLALASQSIVYRLGYLRLIGIINRSGINAAMDSLSATIGYDSCPYKRQEASKAMAVIRDHESRTYSCQGAGNHPYLTL